MDKRVCEVQVEHQGLEHKRELLGKGSGEGVWDIKIIHKTMRTNLLSRAKRNGKKEEKLSRDPDLGLGKY